MSEALSILPVSLDDVLARLPAEDRASLAWLPEAVRKEILAPLRDTPLDQLKVIEPDLIAAARRVMRPLLGATARLLAHPDSSKALWWEPATPSDEVDPIAAADIVAASRWQAAISEAVAREVHADAELLDAEPGDVAHAIEEAAEDPELDFILCGWAYLLAATEELRDPVVEPERLRAWSRNALMHTLLTATILRMQGFPVPTSLPGGAEVPAGVIRFLRAELRLKELWLFGSRALGLFGPESDWDLMAVVEDGTEPPDDHPMFQQLRRRRVDLFVATESSFAEGREIPGTLGHLVARQGTRVLP